MSWVEDKTRYNLWVVAEMLLFVVGTLWLGMSIYTFLSGPVAKGMLMLLVLVIVSHGMAYYRHKEELDTMSDVMKDWDEQDREMEKEVLMR